jgi:DnaK suppressor protein
MSTAPAATASRHATLTRMLRDRRQQVHGELLGRLRRGRDDRQVDGADDLEHSESGTQGDLACALIDMHSELLGRLDEALVRLDAGTYGVCVACEGRIAASRLRALPFAVRCHGCQSATELSERRVRRSEERGGILLDGRLP